MEEHELNKEDVEIVVDKQLINDIYEKIKEVNKLPESRERTFAIYMLQEAVVWLGMDLKRLNKTDIIRVENPSTEEKIEPAADVLK